jgi:hypothetical protein
MLKNIKEIKDFVTEGKLNEAKPKKPGEWAKEYSHLESKDIYQKGDQVVYVRDKGGPWESKQTDTGVIRKVKRGLFVGMNAYVLTDGDEIYQNEILGLSESVNEATESGDIGSMETGLKKATGFPVSVSERGPEYRAKWSYIKGELPNNKWKAAIKYIEEELKGVIDSKRSDNYYEESWERGEPAEAVPTIYFTK